MAEPLLSVSGLTRVFGAVVASDALDLQVRTGELHALIGPNGAGKTTAVSQIAGELAPNAGSIRFDGREITHLPIHRRVAAGLVRSYQITSIFPELSALANVALAVQAHRGHSFHFWRPVRRERTLMDPAMATLERVGLAHRAAAMAATLSHGEKRQLEVAMALACEPKLLLLDEPLAGMGLEESARMVGLLRALKDEITMLLVEHDMDAVFALADRVTVLVYGKALACGEPAAIRDNPAVREAYLGEPQAC